MAIAWVSKVMVVPQLAGWFTMRNPVKKWMITRATSISLNVKRGLINPKRLFNLEVYH